MLEQTAGLYVPMLCGATIAYPTSRQPPTLLGILRKHRIVTMVVVPQALTLLMDGIEREINRRGQALRWQTLLRVAGALPIPLRRVLFHNVHRQLGKRLAFVICGGAHLPNDVIETWERLGIPILEGYGTTECAPIISTNSLSTAGSRSLGPPLPGIEVRIAERNEIQIRGACVSPGYWHDDAATAAAFTGDGWYRTGDIGHLDSAGYLHVQARLKDMIVLPSGLNVFPEDVEREILRENEVADCVVVGMTDDDGNQHVHAVVIPARADVDHQVIRNAIQRANARLAPQQRVSGVSRWEHGDFPRTNLQKVKRHDVLATVKGAPLPAVQSVTPSGASTSQIQDILARVSNVEPERITPESDLVLDLNLDSLSRVELAVAFESELGVSVEDGDLAAVSTVADIAELLERGQTTAPAIPMLRWARGGPARSARGLIQRAVLFPLHRLVCRPFQVTGAEHFADVPGPVLMISNHASHLDTPSILRALPPAIRRRTAVAAAADYFYRSQPFGIMMSLLLNTFPFSREGAVRGSLEYCGELADDGWSILIYPEGTRSPGGALQPFRSGIGLLATELQLPIVPIAVTGSHAILPKGTHLPQPGSITVRFGCPIIIDPDDDRDATTLRLHDAVAKLQTDCQSDATTTYCDRST
jgi:long-chain acyl-CoA synthetase